MGRLVGLLRPCPQWGEESGCRVFQVPPPHTLAPFPACAPASGSLPIPSLWVPVTLASSQLLRLLGPLNS